MSISQSTLTVGISEVSLFAGFSGKLICAQNGSPLPDQLGFGALIQDGTAFTSTRLTEAFAGAFSPKTALAGQNADAGTRFLIQYSGFPQGARLFVPNVVAGSDAVQPTAGGDLGFSRSGGTYAPSASGSLLLALVAGADSTGAGGTVGYTLVAGSGSVTFDSVTELTLAGGGAYAVYEVVDANPLATETVQFPTFLGLAANTVQSSVQTNEGVTYAPVSQVTAATASDPLPRFLPLMPLNDCTIIGDCGASYFPQLTVGSTSLQFPIPGSDLSLAQFVPVINSGAGIMPWTATVTYTNGSGWLSVKPASGVNNGTIQVGVIPGTLTVGTYQATLAVDAGTAGRRLVPVTLTIATPIIPGPVITAVENAASFAQVPVVPGSLTTIIGTGFSGQNVSASFNGLPAAITFSNSKQINLLVPAGLGLPNPAQLVVMVDAQSSAPAAVQVAPFEPGIFAGAVVNQDGTVNSVSNPVSAGSVVYFYATGLSGLGTITARIGATEITNLYYAGPAPGFPGVQQVNLFVPAGLGAVTTTLYACGTNAGIEVCSLGVPLTLK